MTKEEAEKVGLILDEEWSSGKQVGDPGYPFAAAMLIVSWLSDQAAKGVWIPGNVLGAAGYIAGHIKAEETARVETFDPPT